MRPMEWNIGQRLYEMEVEASRLLHSKVIFLFLMLSLASTFQIERYSLITLILNMHKVANTDTPKKPELLGFDFE